MHAQGRWDFPADSVHSAVYGVALHSVAKNPAFSNQDGDKNVEVDLLTGCQERMADVVFSINDTTLTTLACSHARRSDQQAGAAHDD